MWRLMIGRKTRSRGSERRAFRPGAAGIGLEQRECLSTFTVVNTFASGSGSLAGAIQQANLAGGTNTINFAAGVRGQIVLNQQLDVYDPNLTINGPGLNLLSVSDTAGRVLQTHNASVRISGLTFSNSHAISSNFTPGAGGDGGAIEEDGGSLTLTGCGFVNNFATNRGGAVFNFQGSLTTTGCAYVGNSTTFHGGAIYDSGGMVATGNTFSGNSAGEGGGAIEVAASVLQLGGASATLTGNTILGNVASVQGGGLDINNGAVVTSTGNVFLSNHAVQNGGAVSIGPDTTAGSPSFSDTGSSYFSNSALVNGGAIYSKSFLKIATDSIEFNTASIGGAYYALASRFTDGGGNVIAFNSQPQTFLV